MGMFAPIVLIGYGIDVVSTRSLPVSCIVSPRFSFFLFLQLAAPEVLGPGHMAHGYLLRKPSKKKATNQRGLQSRLEALTVLVDKFNLLAPSSGLTADALVAYW